jgi:hypothetical protein
MGKCMNCGQDLGHGHSGYCRSCTEAISGRRVPERITCATCDGSGRGANGQTCPDCNGQGSISTEDWK